MDIKNENFDFELVTDDPVSLTRDMGTGCDNDNAKSMSKWDIMLVRVGRERDKAAFAALFDYFAPRIKSFLLRLGTDMSLCEEIAQEAMIMVWRRAETYNPNQSGASTWIFTIARNKRIDRLRRENRPLPDLSDPAFAPEAIETGEKAIFRQQE